MGGELTWAQRSTPTAVLPQRVAKAGRRRFVVGAADDQLERDADRVADRILASTSVGTFGQPTRIRRSSAPVDRASVTGRAGGVLGERTARSLGAESTGGVPMDADSRARFGRALGADLSSVRIHTDARADALNRSMGSRAFTNGAHVFIGRGENLQETSGQHLLAHELAHVAQQRSGADPGRIRRKLPKSAHAGGLDEFNRIEGRPAGTPHKDQGIASKPVGFEPPAFKVVVTPGKSRFSAKVVLTRKANPGDSEATYLAPGQHDSGFLWASDALYDGHPVSNRMLTPAQAGRDDTEPVIFNVTSAVAKQSKAAEQEHLDDYRYAFRISLEAAQQAIVAVGKRRFKHAHGANAGALAREALLQEISARSNRHLTTLDPTDWQNEYRRLFTRSGIRDTSSWHIQDLTENTAVANPIWGGLPCRIVDVAPGPSFNLGTVSSQQQIDPGPAPVIPVVANVLTQDDDDGQA